MSNAEELFNKAYNLSVVEERHREAIDLCRKAREIEPNNYRVLVYLGMLLGDHGSDQEILEARQCFVTAIEKAPSVSSLCTNWPEEAAIHHLGIWEWSQGHYFNASLFFLIDKFFCHNTDSVRMLKQLTEETDLPVVRDVELIFRRIMAENEIVPRASSSESTIQ